MRILIVGAGGVGSAVPPIAARRDFFETIVFADYEKTKARRVVERYDDRRFVAARVDASDAASVAAVAQEHRCDAILNAVDPRFVMPVFRAAFDVGAVYMDMAMSLSEPHPERPYELVGKKLGDDQFAEADRWEERGLLALVGCGVEPGMSDVFARHAAESLYDSTDQEGARGAQTLCRGGHVPPQAFSMGGATGGPLTPPL